MGTERLESRCPSQCSTKPAEEPAFGVHYIVCSYIIHEDESVGLEPFVKYIPIADYLNTRAAMSDSGIAKEPNYVDITRLRDEATSAQESLTASYDIEHDRFQRKWTKFDLRAMAKRRDELTATLSPISKDSLERDYVSLYKSASSIVHSDCSALSHDYLNIFAVNPNSPAVLMPLPSWAMINVAFTSHYDIIQVFEVLTLLGFACENEFVELRDRWLAATKKHS